MSGLIFDEAVNTEFCKTECTLLTLPDIQE